jgi:hypothetical protein
VDGWVVLSLRENPQNPGETQSRAVSKWIDIHPDIAEWEEDFLSGFVVLFLFPPPPRFVKRTSSRPAVRSYKCRTCQTNRKCASRVLRTHRRGFSIMRIVFGCCVYCAVNTVVALGNSSCCCRD